MGVSVVFPVLFAMATMATSVLSAHDAPEDTREAVALPQAQSSQTHVAGPKGRFAYVTIHYEGTADDAAYVLGIRVLMQSLKPLAYPFIILVSDSVTAASRDQFIKEGATLIRVRDVLLTFPV